MSNNDNKLSATIKGNNKKFLKNVVDSASPVQLIILLYEGCAQWLNMAKLEIKKNQETKLVNWSNYSHYMGMAAEILRHLEDCLDRKQAPDFAERMSALYDFMRNNVAKANANKNEKLIDEVINLLKEIKDTWKEAAKKSATLA